MDYERTVWITGTGGLIGSYLAKTACKFVPQWRVVPLNHSELELTDHAAVESRFRAEKPDLIIHCAALSRSPECQSNPALARRLNVEVTTRLAGLIADGQLIFFSTDLVFDGRKNSPYVESDPTNPLSVYAETKLAAEQIVLKNPRHAVVRTSLNGGASPKGRGAFNEELCASWREGKAVKLFTDEFRCPIAASVTARAIWELAQTKQPGLFHLAGAERLSRLQIGQLIAARHPELNPQIIPGSLREYQGAPRPADLALNCSKIQQLLGFPLPAFSEWLKAGNGPEF